MHNTFIYYNSESKKKPVISAEENVAMAPFSGAVSLIVLRSRVLRSLNFIEKQSIEDQSQVLRKGGRANASSYRHHLSVELST